MFLDDCIFEEVVVDKKICNNLLEWFVSNKHLQHQAMMKNPKTDKNHIDEKEKVAIQSWADGYAFSLIKESIDLALFKYKNNVGYPKQYELVSKDYNVRIYPKGKGLFNDHIDTGTSQTFDRLLAFILYLNDVDEGGETEFLNTGRKIKPVEGKVLIFPCNYLFPHRGNIPVSGDKYIATSFLYRL
jgi:hypothetical protein